MDKNKWFKFIFFIFLLYDAAFCRGVFAEEVLTWDNCVNEALKNHPDLISAREEVKQAKADKNITRSALLPQITSQVSAGKSQTDPKKQTDTYSYGVTGEQLIFDGFKTAGDIKAASETLSAQEYNYAVVSSNIRLNLRSAFVSLLRAQELISLTEEIASRRKQNFELVQLRYEAGREHKGALLTAQADLAEAEFEVTQAKRNLSLAQRELTKELGRRRKTPVEVKGDFDINKVNSVRDSTPEADDTPSFNGTISNGVNADEPAASPQLQGGGPDFESLADTTPFLKELIAKKESARFSYNSAQADFFPQVYLSGSFGRTYSAWPPKNNDWSTRVTLSFPIFEGTSKIDKVSKAKSQLRQAQADELSGRDSVIFTLEEAWNNFQDAIDTVEVRNKFVEADYERAKIAGAQYSTGLITFDDWIIIENNLITAKKSSLDAQSDLLIAEADWVQAKGGILDYEK